MAEEVSVACAWELAQLQEAMFATAELPSDSSLVHSLGCDSKVAAVNQDECARVRLITEYRIWGLVGAFPRSTHPGMYPSGTGPVLRFVNGHVVSQPSLRVSCLDVDRMCQVRVASDIGNS